jgi:hypothetical protein
VVFWGGITFAVGMVLLVIEVVHAARKKEGVTPTDKQRISGIFWITCLMSALVAGLIWLAGD